MSNPVYPRWRGEHVSTKSGGGSRLGLSPLARGTLRCVGHHRIGARFIPAGAGNTHAFNQAVYSRTVYPRWRGEHGLMKIADSMDNGLSPLARGTLDPVIPNQRAVRFIPAGAGNTSSSAYQHRMTPVYPRWRGEHFPRPSLDLACNGLSPLARGTQHDFEYTY